MINDEDIVLIKNNVEEETSQLIATNRNDDISSLTIEEKSNICTEQQKLF